MNANNAAIESPYAKKGLVNRVLDAITDAGVSLDNLSPDNLMAFDEFHVRGRLATKELCELAGINDKMHVLDIGSGLGGPSRFLAANYGCRVTGIDITREYCELAEVFAEKFNLNKKLNYHCGSATELPFDDCSFEAVWTQHTAMNIKNKTKLYAESARVLKPAGKFIIYDILAGANQPVYYPVPWARTDDISFLATPVEMKTYLNKSDMDIIHWSDKTQIAIEWFQSMIEKINIDGPPKLSFQLFLGDDFVPMLTALLKNLKENRVAVVEIIAKK